ncbi:fungal-specific transcription factor domain-containing protein [Hypoxylon rubiginosum]|uniref:Fungal-specific transcription factor domain-containing protein n=1 Tax=Hypoxylon rubiginosum TaxID=110542 RepID=A0ACB9Z8J9_9PEZI|nr:fungal-specific transcription factor domain-containing protein [Hypoxylon rubiginosum]
MDQQSTAARQAQPSQTQSQVKPLSCTNCRARKLKCSREYPCHHCLRTGTECVFPTRKRIRKPRRNKNSELLQRLSRLESIVGEVGLSDLAQGKGKGRGGGGGNPAATAGASRSSGTGSSALPPNLIASSMNAGPLVEEPESPGQTPRAVDGSTQQQNDWQKPLQESKASRYLSGEFWSSLCCEVEGLRQTLEQSTDSDEEDQPLQEATPDSAANDRTSPSATSAFSPGMLLGSGSSRLSYDDAVEHPPPDHIRYLTQTFFTNVDMILKILHRPTVEATLRALADAPTPELRPQLSPELEALVFSIYHAAVASLSDDACLVNLQRRREDLTRSFAAAVEHLLVRADYLGSARLETLQALTLYVACVRSTRGSRASWALLSLPVRLAQALHLHREAGSAGRSPYETELRRRLWWQLIVLDIRASEDRGTTTIVARDSYDTHLPLNLNDADFGPDTPGPLVERQGPTDVTFSLCTARSSGIFLYVEHAHQGAAGFVGGSSAGEACALVPPPRSVEETVRHAQSLEAQFVATADPSHAPSYLASVAVRLIILKLWLIMQYPLHPRRRPRPASREQVSGMFPTEATLRTAISIVELNEYLRTGPYGDRFRWWAETYVQWHPLAVALAELCALTRGDLADRAWRIIDDGFPAWSEVIADTKSGALWRPLRKLYKKAKAARLAANAPDPSATATTDATTGNTTTTTAMEVEQGDEADSGTIFVRTDLDDRPPEGGDNTTTTITTTTAEPQGAYQMDISSAREPSMPPDLDTLSTSPYALSQSMWGWADLNFDIQFLDLGAGSGGPSGPNPMEWSAWDDFVNEAQAEGQQQGSGSSEGDL